MEQAISLQHRRPRHQFQRALQLSGAKGSGIEWYGPHFVLSDALWSQVPWEDLRYLFGEIMYGGHITDDWDRRLCKVYLEELMSPEQLEVSENIFKCANILAMILISELYL